MIEQLPDLQAEQAGIEDFLADVAESERKGNLLLADRELAEAQRARDCLYQEKRKRLASVQQVYDQARVALDEAEKQLNSLQPDTDDPDEITAFYVRMREGRYHSGVERQADETFEKLRQAAHAAYTALNAASAELETELNDDPEMVQAEADVEAAREAVKKLKIAAPVPAALEPAERARIIQLLSDELDLESTGQLHEHIPFVYPLHVQTPSGVLVAATDSGLLGEQEDTVVISTDASNGAVTMAIIDGIGSLDGKLGAGIMAGYILKGIAGGYRPAEVQVAASRAMTKPDLITGVCYATLTISTNQLKVASAGDVRVVVIRPTDAGHTLVFSTIDQVRENNISQVTNWVGTGNPGMVIEESVNLQPGDIVAGFSDGIGDQLWQPPYTQIQRHSDQRPKGWDLPLALRTANERLAKFILSSLTSGATLDEVVKKIGDLTFDAQMNDGNPDNRSLVLYQHGG